MGVTGFGMGGALSLAAGALLQDGVDAIAPFYGIPDEKLCNVSTIKCPVQCHFGALDDMVGFSSRKDAEKLEEKLKAGKVDYEMNIYDGAAHAFTNGIGPNYNTDSCHLALERLFTFMNKSLVE